MFKSIGSLAPIILIFSILLFAIKNKIQIFDSFINGAREGIECIFSILPILVSLVTSIEMLKASGVIELITTLISPLTSTIRFPSQCVPLILMKPISGSGSNAILYSLLKSYGSESKIGNISSLVAGSNEAILYIVSTYCGAVKIKDTKKIIFYAFLSFISSVICAFLIC